MTRRPAETSAGVVRRGVSRHGLPGGDDRLAVEEPLEIRVAGETIAVTMRTPGDDAELALGFLMAEGVLRSSGDVGAVAHCGRASDPDFGNTIEVTLAPGARLTIERVDKMKRGTVTTSACGVCGRKSIDDLVAMTGRVADGPALAAGVLTASTAALQRHQPLFEQTGGVHAAAVLSDAGVVLSSAEDVGRHNAADKALGALLRSGRLPARRGPGEPAVLVVSGRASFELVQKAAMAGLGALASVSAASSLAVDLAEAVGLTLVCFVRGGSMNVYTHPERIAPAPLPLGEGPAR